MTTTFEPNEDPFAAYVETPAAGRGRAAKSSSYESSKLVKLQRLNTVFRLMTFVFTLSAVFSTFFAKETSSETGWEAEYKYFTSFQFLLYANSVVCLYALLISVLAIIMRSGIGVSQPNSMTLMIIILNSTACIFLLLAFAAGTATEIISRNGWQFSKTGYYNIDTWRLCDDYNSFCVVIELGLGFTGFAFINLAAGTGIDAYYKSQMTR